MPTYEYRCRACGHAFEAFQKISEAPIDTCPDCEAVDVQRLISAGGGLVFKGSGFYATDYRKDGPKKSDSESASESGSGESGSGKSESKGGDSSDASGDS
jgi:putative FmdB family regulatory protein